MQQSYLSESELFASRSLQLLEVIKAESGIFFICLYMYIYIELVSADSLNLESFDQASFAHAQSIFAAERMRQWKSREQNLHQGCNSLDLLLSLLQLNYLNL